MANSLFVNGILRISVLRSNVIELLLSTVPVQHYAYILKLRVFKRMS